MNGEFFPRHRCSMVQETENLLKKSHLSKLSAYTEGCLSSGQEKILSDLLRGTWVVLQRERKYHVLSVSDE